MSWNSSTSRCSKRPAQRARSARVLLEEAHRPEQEVAEVRRPGPRERRLVAGVDLPRELPLDVVLAGRVSAGLEREPLPLVDAGERLARGERLAVVRAELGEDPLHEPELVVVVVDRERLGEPGARRLAAEEARAEGVEGLDPQLVRRGAEQRGEPLAHLARRLVREGDGEDVPGDDALLADEPRDAVDDDAGLAAARAGEDEQRARRRGARPRAGRRSGRARRSRHAAEGRDSAGRAAPRGRGRARRRAGRAPPGASAGGGRFAWPRRAAAARAGASGSPTRSGPPARPAAARVPAASSRTAFVHTMRRGRSVAGSVTRRSSLRRRAPARPPPGGAASGAGAGARAAPARPAQRGAVRASSGAPPRRSAASRSARGARDAPAHRELHRLPAAHPGEERQLRLRLHRVRLAEPQVGPGPEADREVPELLRLGARRARARARARAPPAPAGSARPRGARASTGRSASTPSSADELALRADPLHDLLGRADRVPRERAAGTGGPRARSCRASRCGGPSVAAPRRGARSAR